MIEVYKDGHLVMQFENHGKTFESHDIMVLPKEIADQCKMTAESFKTLYFNFLAFTNRTTLTHEQAYEQAEKIHQQYLGKRRYKNFDSFRKVRDQRRTE